MTDDPQMTREQAVEHLRATMAFTPNQRAALDMAIAALRGVARGEETVTTYTPMLWAVLTDDQRYEEYIRVRQLLRGVARGETPEEKDDHGAGLAAAQAIPQLLSDYRQATTEERAMARGFVALWQSVGVQDAEDWLYALRNRAELLATLDEDDSSAEAGETPTEEKDTRAGLAAVGNNTVSSRIEAASARERVTQWATTASHAWRSRPPHREDSLENAAAFAGARAILLWLRRSAKFRFGLETVSTEVIDQLLTELSDGNQATTESSGHNRGSEAQKASFSPPIPRGARP